MTTAGPKWTAYTDGACAPTNPGPSGWGAVLIAPGDGSESDHFGFIGPGTNQVAELTAAIEGLARVPAGAAVELVSDSQYVLKGLTEWRTGWERKGWRNSKAIRSPIWVCGSGSSSRPTRGA